jgi:hypothetical protein
VLQRDKEDTFNDFITELAKKEKEEVIVLSAVLGETCPQTRSPMASFVSGGTTRSSSPSSSAPSQVRPESSLAGLAMYKMLTYAALLRGPTDKVTHKSSFKDIEELLADLKDPEEKRLRDVVDPLDQQHVWEVRSASRMEPGGRRWAGSEVRAPGLTWTWVAPVVQDYQDELEKAFEEKMRLEKVCVGPARWHRGLDNRGQCLTRAGATGGEAEAGEGEAGGLQEPAEGHGHRGEDQR